MPVTQHASGLDRTTTARRYVHAGWQRLKLTMRELAMVVGAVAWAGFWIGIARLHYTTTDLLGVGASVALALIGCSICLWRLTRLAMDSDIGQFIGGLADGLLHRIPTPDRR